MQPTDDSLLLQQYVENHSDEAFAALVTRHINLVYSVALRCVGDPHQAEEVVQAVFIQLAKKAAQLRHDKALSSWLFQTTRFTASNFIRGETRRHRREQEAHMQSVLNEPGSDVWPKIAPLLDDAVAGLSEKDRHAIVLRFYEGRNLREVGAVLGTSEDAAEKRVSRAIERLREFFAKRGVTIGSSGLVLLISANAVQAAPVGLAVTISTAAALAGTAVQISVGAVATKTVVVTTTQKVLVTVTLLMSVAVFILLRNSSRTHQGDIDNASRSAATNAEHAQQAAALAAQEANATEQDREPDPLKLLQTVARARQRITSGSLDLQIFVDHIEGGRTRTNHQTISILFDDSKRRFDARMRDYAYIPLGSDDSPGAKETNRLADSMDREAAVRAGYLQGRQTHVVSASAGDSFLQFRETEGQSGSTTIEDRSSGSSYFFDPRCLGMNDSLHQTSTIEGCLAYDGAKAIKLLGEEAVDGIPAWHVFVETKYDALFDFWIDIKHPERVLKYAHANEYGSEWAVSKYDASVPGHPLPVEVTTWRSQLKGTRIFASRYVRAATQLNIQVEPASFTLAGLGMPIGTDISDIRNHRIIGHWNGTGLNEWPLRTGAGPQPGPDPAALSDLLENHPSSPDALEAAQWIISNTPDGPEVEKAARVILQEHLQNTNLIKLCIELERLQHRCSTNLLDALLKNNPSTDVRGTACFALATLAKEEAHYGTNKNATARAEKFLEEVIAKFPKVKQRGYNLADLAKPELNEVRHLFIGHPAPETEGQDLDGQPLKLSDYRGKVVVLTFWYPGYSEAIEHRKLAERMEGKPFACLGVYTDDKDDNLTKAKADVEKYGITWPSFRDKRDGPIWTQWHARGWPDIWVLDAKGIIRHRNLRGGDLVNAVEALLKE